MIAGAASREERNVNSARAASGSCAVLVRTPAKENIGCTSAGRRADECNAGNMDEFGHLLEADLRLAARDHGRHRFA